MPWRFLLTPKVPLYQVIHVLLSRGNHQLSHAWVRGQGLAISSEEGRLREPSSVGLPVEHPEAFD